MHKLAILSFCSLFACASPRNVVSLPGATPDATPGFNQRIPESLMTPDHISTSIGAMEFYDGIPTETTVERVYENLDRSRAVEAFLDFIPAASIEAMRIGHEQLGIDSYNEVLLFDGLMDSNSLFLTGNTDTVYASTFLDLREDGPTVIEIPPGAGPGTVNDAFFRFVIDMGAPGPDRGKGGKYLILPPDHKGDVPEGFFVAQSTSYSNWLILRGFLKDGSPEAASRMWRDGLKVYPLSEAASPTPMEFVSGTGMVFNTIHSNDFHFFEEVDGVIQREPADFVDPELRGVLSSLGIRKGHRFAPNERERRVLADGVAIGNATARALAFAPRTKSAFLYEGDEGWFTAFDGGDYRWLIEDGDGGRNMDARTFFFYIATVNTPAMVLKMVGVGSQYALCAKDGNGDYLRGDRSYKLTLPAGIPAKQFWSLVAYDPQTRSMLQTQQPYPSRNSERNQDELVYNQDGSIDIYFGPVAPEGHDSNWIQTVPGKAWFTCLRLYGPLESWFDQTWRPGKIELL